MKAAALLLTVLVSCGAGIYVGARMNARAPRVVVQHIVRVNPTISTAVFLRERDHDFQQLFNRWRVCQQSMAEIEILSIHARYNPVHHRSK